MTVLQRRIGIVTVVALVVAVGVFVAVALLAGRRPVRNPLRHPAKPASTVSVDDAAPRPDLPLEFQAVPPETAEALNAARPDYAGRIVPARTFSISGGFARDGAGERALDCLAAAVYYEARSEPLEGQRAVAQVVLNRVRDPLFPASVCGVVFQGSDRLTGCQFTFTCDGSLLVPPREPLWSRARAVARAALDGYVDPNVGLATHYHTRWVVPVWRNDLVKLRTIGAHIFYGWQGRATSSRGLRAAYAGFEPPFIPGFGTEAAPVATANDEGIAGAQGNGFAAALPPESGPVVASGAAPPPPSSPLQADVRAGALIAHGSRLKSDDAPVPLSKLGGTLPQ